MKFLVSFLCSLLVSAVAAGPALAQAPQPPEVNAKSFLLLDIGTMIWH